MTITESIKFNKLKEENEKLKKELAEKDKEIEKLKYINGRYSDELYSRDETQLFKEDFENKFIEYSSFDNFVKEKYVLKDNLKYDTLPSKDVK